MKKLGYLNVTSKVYDSLRHELLQEEEKDIIIKDIISFIKILDYLYCTYDLDRFSNIMSGFYKSADDIFNSFET